MSLTDSNAQAAELRGPWRLVELASKVPGVVVAVVSAVAIGVLVVMGTLQRVAFPEWGAANLDSEASVATLGRALVGRRLMVAVRRKVYETPIAGNLDVVADPGLSGARRR